MQIVEIVLRQGLVHPITCVPYLIALETDPEELNSKLAHQLLMNMNEKYSSLDASMFFLLHRWPLTSNKSKFSGILLSSKAVWVMAFRCHFFSYNQQVFVPLEIQTQKSKPRYLEI